MRFHERQKVVCIQNLLNKIHSTFRLTDSTFSGKLLLLLNGIDFKWSEVNHPTRWIGRICSFGNFLIQFPVQETTGLSISPSLALGKIQNGCCKVGIWYPAQRILIESVGKVGSHLTQAFGLGLPVIRHSGSTAEHAFLGRFFKTAYDSTVDSLTQRIPCHIF